MVFLFMLMVPSEENSQPTSQKKKKKTRSIYKFKNTCRGKKSPYKCPKSCAPRGCCAGRAPPSVYLAFSASMNCHNSPSVCFLFPQSFFFLSLNENLCGISYTLILIFESRYLKCFVVSHFHTKVPTLQTPLHQAVSRDRPLDG